MRAFTIFLNVLAWVFLIATILRVILIFVWESENKNLVRMAGNWGFNIVGDALFKSFIVGVICLAWLISRCYA